VEFKLPGLPAFAKDQIAIFWLLVGVLLFHRQSRKESCTYRHTRLTTRFTSS
jgi:hypothetical protein